LSLGENIYKLRRERKWSQDKLGKMVKIDGRQICRYEKENSVPSAETLRKLAEAFEVTVDYLLSANSDSEFERPQIKDPELFDFFREIDQMGAKERSAIKFVLETFVNNSRARQALSTNKTND
jgi:transcriptional regulator with XRE-family HTH domain